MKALSDFLLVVSAVALIAFPFAYHLITRGHWRDSVMGRHLMAFMAVLAFVMATALFAIAYDLPEWVRTVRWLLVAVVSWWRLILLFVVQMRDERSSDDQVPL